MAERGTQEEYTEAMVAFAEGVVAVIDLFDQDTDIAEYGEIGDGLKAMADAFSERRKLSRESIVETSKTKTRLGYSARESGICKC